MVHSPFRNNDSLQFLFDVTEDEFFTRFPDLHLPATPQVQPASTSGPTSEILMHVWSIILIDLALNRSWLLTGFRMLCYMSSADKLISCKGCQSPNLSVSGSLCNVFPSTLTMHKCVPFWEEYVTSARTRRIVEFRIPGDYRTFQAIMDCTTE